MRILLLPIFILFSVANSLAQKVTVQQYIDMYKDIAMAEMIRTGVPAAITLAQGLLETESGNSDLVKKSNNHFGIKCKSEWTGATVYHDDDARGECFRAYTDPAQSYRDHSDFLKNRSPYAALFRLDPADYKAWAYGLKKAGYATNPAYPQILIKFIQENNLQQYSLLALNRAAQINNSVAVALPAVYNQNVSTQIQSAQTEIKLTSINNCKVEWVLKGTSLLAVASAHRINLNKLLEFNDLTEDGLLKTDQYIYLEKKSKEGSAETYISQLNETLWDVAQKNGVRLQNLISYNIILPQVNGQLAVGTTILLKGISPQHNTNPLPSSLKVHEVKPKEGLYGISKKYGISVSQIREWNNLHTDSLHPGQQLIVSK
ncbi:glucosaminidase domain-containing protein [soil metagenome]